MEKKAILETLLKAKEGCQKYDALAQQIRNEQQRVYNSENQMRSKRMRTTVLIGMGIGMVLGIAFTAGGPAVLDVIVLGGILGVVAHFVRKPIMKKAHNELIGVVNQNINSLNQQIKEVAEQYNGVLSIVPDDYWFTQAIGQLIKYFQQDRADDIKEALHLLDEQIHRWKLEDQNNEILVAQQQHAEYLASIDANSKSAAIGAWANLGANLFKD